MIGESDVTVSEEQNSACKRNRRTSASGQTMSAEELPVEVVDLEASDSENSVIVIGNSDSETNSTADNANNITASEKTLDNSAENAVALIDDNESSGDDFQPGKQNKYTSTMRKRRRKYKQMSMNSSDEENTVAAEVDDNASINQHDSSDEDFSTPKHKKAKPTRRLSDSDESDNEDADTDGETTENRNTEADKDEDGQDDEVVTPLRHSTRIKKKSAEKRQQFQVLTERMKAAHALRYEEPSSQEIESSQEVESSQEIESSQDPSGERKYRRINRPEESSLEVDQSLPDSIHDHDNESNAAVDNDGGQVDEDACQTNNQDDDGVSGITVSSNSDSDRESDEGIGRPQNRAGPIECSDSDDDDETDDFIESDIGSENGHYQDQNRESENDDDNNEIKPYRMSYEACFKILIEQLVLRSYNPENEVIIAENLKPAVDKLDRKVNTISSAAQSAAWCKEFVNSVKKYPFLKKTPESHREVNCQVCCRPNRPSSWVYEFQGQPYNRDTLNNIGYNEQESDGDRISFIVGRFCNDNAKKFHKLYHYKKHLLISCQRKVRDLRYKYMYKRQISEQDMVELCFEDTDWVEQQFRYIRGYLQER